MRLRHDAYLPEAFAYRNYLATRGHEVLLLGPGEPPVTSDIDIRFMGLDAPWRAASPARAVVHEYHSLSVGRLPRFKNRLKRAINRRPSGRIFLNELVKREMGFADDVPCILRDMGVHGKFFQYAPENPEFDLVYSGTLDRYRPGLVEEIERLAGLGLSLLIIGTVDEPTRERLGRLSSVELAGRVGWQELPELYVRARAGLDYTPDIYPHNVQTRTKTLEYCAAGLGVVSNRYAWSADFSRRMQTDFLWLEQLRSADDFHRFRFSSVDMSAFEWEAVLSRCGFEAFLERLL